MEVWVENLSETFYDTTYYHTSFNNHTTKNSKMNISHEIDITVIDIVGNLSAVLIPCSTGQSLLVILHFGLFKTEKQNSVSKN